MASQPIDTHFPVLVNQFLMDLVLFWNFFVTFDEIFFPSFVGMSGTRKKDLFRIWAPLGNYG